jgi:hypothetical protein
MRKPKWSEVHEAYIGGGSYEIHRERSVWICYVKRREMYDCYSSTRVDRLYEVGKSKGLDEAKSICVKHAADSKEEAAE